MKPCRLKASTPTLVYVAFLFLISFSQAFAKEEQVCGTLYAGENFSGNKLPFTDMQQISAFSEHHLNAQDTWNTTSSFRVSNKCSFIACNESYFEGTCKLFNQDMPVLASDFRALGSANCSCEGDCKCQNIMLRKSECARAYIGGGCNTCNAFYSDFRNQSAFIGETFKSKISSIIVRPGCQLEVFEEENFDGEESEIVEGVVEEWKKDISSYQCTCDGAHSDPDNSGPKIRPASYPPIIEIPDTPDAIMALLNGKDRHAGLMKSLQSIKSKRSPKNAYIMLLGLTGAGKSSSINLLFDNPNITKVGDGVSITSDIWEFRIPVPVDELGLSNTELRVIDTPGLGDTRGLESDAKFLATLDGYLSSHEELNTYIPNVVLVFAKFNDNRIRGDGASFVKMLRGVDLFRERLTDKKFSNVIFVLSHYMSETKLITRTPTNRLNDIKRTIEDFSLFPKPVTLVVAENKGQEEDLPMLNGYFKLPNGDFYPKNLFDKIQLSTTSGQDPIGEAIIRTAFKNADNFNVSSTKFSLVESKHGKVLYYMGILSRGIFTSSDTEVSKALAAVHEDMSPDLKRKFPDALPYLQRSFDIRNIHLKTHIPRTTVDIVKFLKEIRQNEATMYLMDKAFALRMPELKENLVAGYGYNVIDDVMLPSTPFQFGEKVISDIGYMIPNVLTAKVENSVRNFYETFPSQAGYVEFRLQNLNVRGAVPPENFKGVIKPGCNVVDLNNLTTVDGQVFSAVREHRMYELVLNDRLSLTKEFQATVKALPTFNSSDYDGIEIWKKFFTQYGTHVVKSAHGGGSIEIQLKSTEPLSDSISQAMFSIVQFAEDVSIGKVSGLSLETNGTQYTLKFKGGDFKYHASTLSSMSLSDAAKLLENWKESLAFSPVMLSSDMKLLPISEVAKKLGQNVSAEIQRAALALFNSTLRYVPPPKHVLPPDARENVRPTEEAGTDRLALVVEKMMEESRKSSERFEAMMLQMNNEARERETQREKERAEAMKWQRERQAKIDDQNREDRERQKDRELLLEKQREEAKKELALQRLDDQRRQEQQEFLRRAEQEENNRRHLEMMEKLAKRPPVVVQGGGGGGRCLKKGTLIRIAPAGDEVPIENIEVGDFVLDMDLVPSRVSAVSRMFIDNEKFYGFDNKSQFFTQTHMFVGPDNYYVVHKDNLLQANPLMAYLNVKEFGVSKFNISTFNSNYGLNKVETKTVELFQDHITYDPDTIVYFIQVDSKTGTYFANDYVCRHEIPPLEKWPRTITTLFAAFTDPRVQFIKNAKYTRENMATVEELVGSVYENIENILDRPVNLASVPAQNVSFEGFDFKETMAQLLEQDIFANMAIGIYGLSGPRMAEIMDSGEVSEQHLAIQKIIFSSVVDEILKYEIAFK